MERVFNFSPGPAMLPDAVLRRRKPSCSTGRAAACRSWRSATAARLSSSSRQAGARPARAARGPGQLQGAVPAGRRHHAVRGRAAEPRAAGRDVDYVVTGNWGEKAVGEAQRYCHGQRRRQAARPRSSHSIPDPATWQRHGRRGVSALHAERNDRRRRVPSIPEVSDAPLVADMSSTILSRPIDVSRFGSSTRVRRRTSAPRGSRRASCARICSAARAATRPASATTRLMAENDSMWNTPPTLRGTSPGSCSSGSRSRAASPRWARSTSARPRSCTPRSMRSGFYRNPVDAPCRSWMNVPFTLAERGARQDFPRAGRRRRA